MVVHRKKLLTVITEVALEGTLVRDFERLGAGGYTITDARGKGTRGVRNAGWDISSNIRIEIICDAALAEAIAGHLQANYYDNYAMAIWLTDIDLWRPSRTSSDSPR